jgi:hypothetical protein
MERLIVGDTNFKVVADTRFIEDGKHHNQALRLIHDHFDMEIL